MTEHAPSHTDKSSTGIEAPEAVKQGYNPKGIVFYTDGSCRPSNPGNVGWGSHGYYFEMVPPTKGSGHSTLTPSRTGYVEKNKKLPIEQQVTILKYFDFFGTNRDIGSNNLAELDAVLNSLRKASEFELNEITIHTDSEYVRRTLDEKIPTMKERGWRKPDGKPYSNVESWRALVELVEEFEQKDVSINIFYVEGHSGDFGNDKADKLATVAALTAVSGLHRHQYTVEEPQGYWKSAVERHPFINNKALYFNTISRGHIPGEYYTGNHDKDLQLLGRRDPNSAYAVVMLEEPNPIIEMLRKHVTACAEEIDCLVVTRFDRLFNPSVYSELLDFGPIALVRSAPYSLDFKGLDKEPITEEIRPLRIGYRAIQEVSKLKKILLDVRAGNENLFVKEITDVFYETEMKKAKSKDALPTKVIKLKSGFGIGVDKVRVNIIIPNTDKEMEITLNLGTDLVDRNALRQLEEYSPQIFVVSWSDSEGAIRFATIGKAGKSWAIWCGAYSNIIFKQPSEVKDVVAT